MELQNNFCPMEDSTPQGHAHNETLPWNEGDCGCSREGRCRCMGESLPENALSGFSLAMVYSPYQVFQSIYEPQEGLSRGTIFAELDKPFTADGRCF